jgi:hypothetical protein
MSSKILELAPRVSKLWAIFWCRYERARVVVPQPSGTQIFSSAVGWPTCGVKASTLHWKLCRNHAGGRRPGRMG